jgi:hypothetical protein
MFGHTLGHSRRVFRWGGQKTEGKRAKATGFLTVASSKSAGATRDLYDACERK